MEFNEKLQQLRKRRGLTQEDLAGALYVSRTAVSKWESGRGYPNIDSLKALAAFFGVTIDELLSGDELLTLAEEDGRQKEKRRCALIFGLLDLSVAMLLVLPFFGQEAKGVMQGVALIALTEISAWLKALYLAAVLGTASAGLLSLALQKASLPFWEKHRNQLSFVMNAGGALLFIISRQPYAAAFLFVYLLIKALMLIKWP